MLVNDKVCPKNNFLLWDYDHSNFGPIFRLLWVIFSLSIYLMFVLHIQDKLSDPAFWWTDYWSKIFGKASSTCWESNGKRDAILPEKKSLLFQGFAHWILFIFQQSDTFRIQTHMSRSWMLTYWCVCTFRPKERTSSYVGYIDTRFL